MYTARAMPLPIEQITPPITKSFYANLKIFPCQNAQPNFTTVAALALPDGTIITKEGRVDGYIAFDYSGANGFGYDPLFIVKDLNKTMAEMTLEEKNKISHRARAFAQIAEVLKKLS